MRNTSMVDEKVDVYSLGSVMYHVLVGQAPRGKMKKERVPLVRPAVARGDFPVLPEELANATETSLVVLRKAIRWCHTVDPVERPSARQVADFLLEALEPLLQKRKQNTTSRGFEQKAPFS
mmetsp:Transcript_30742/g.70841  ORF Transcript_30742/g.70841 Transcript_30742/m.70841 type:complete len:121 (-) Transcript_30742:102-464(-)